MNNVLGFEKKDTKEVKETKVMKGQKTIFEYE